MGEKPINEVNTTTSSYMSTLPPGCRFYPSDEQLLCYYLASKNNATNDEEDTNPNGFNVIKEINLYNFDPFDLPETTCFRFGRGARRRHWYCYVARALEKRGKRRAGSGYWKIKGRVKDIVAAGAGKTVVGTRRTFVFHLGHDAKESTDAAASSVRTHWLMYEYALHDHPKASFVLCRVFVKPHRGNNPSENVFSSCAEESIPTIRHIGVQCDEIDTSVPAETKTEDNNNSSNHENEGLINLPMGQINDELNDLSTSGPHTEPMVLSNGYITDEDDTLTAEELLCIGEDDFLELDDLLSPLSDID